MTSHRLRNLLRLFVFAGFVLILIRIIDPQLLKDVLRQVRPEIVCAAIGLYFVNIAIRACRLKMILNQYRTLLTFKETYAMTLIGIALNIVIPATMGDIAKSYYGYKIYGLKEEMLSTALVDKMFALCALFILGTASGYMMGYPVLGMVALVAAGLTFVPLSLPGLVPWHLVNRGLRVFKKSLDVEKLLRAFTLPLTLKARVMLVSLGGWLCTCVFFYVLASAFPVKVSLGYVIAIMPVITIVRLFPFTVNALGPMEVAVAYFFGLIGIDATTAVLISLTSNLIASLLPGSIGLFLMLTATPQRRALRREVAETDSSDHIR